MASEPASTQSLRPLQAWRAGAIASEPASAQSLRPLQAWRVGAVASEPASAQSLCPLSLHPLRASVHCRAGAVASEPASTQSLRPLQAWRVEAMASEPASAQSLCPLQGGGRGLGACVCSGLRPAGAIPVDTAWLSPHFTDGLFPGRARRAGERGLSVDHHAALRLPGRELPGKCGPRGPRPVTSCQGF